LQFLFLNLFPISERKYLRSQPNEKIDKYWEKIGLLLSATIAVFALLPLILPPPAVFIDLDPFVCTFYRLIPIDVVCCNNNICVVLGNVFIVIFRLISSFVCVMEAAQFCSIIVSFIAFMLELLARCLDDLQHIPSGSMSEFVTNYQALQLVNQFTNQPISPTIALMMGIGFVMFVVSNIATIRFFQKIPIHVYWLAPTISVICAFLVLFLLPLVVDVHRQSSKMLRNRMKVVQTCRCVRVWKKVRVLQIKSLRPIVYSCGSIVKLGPGVERMYFYGIVLRTLDGLLLPIFTN